MALDPTRRPIAGARIPATEVAVVWLQRQLNSGALRPGIAEDGVMGPQTEAALRAYVTGVLRQPVSSPVYVAQVNPTDRTRVAVSTALEAALAGAAGSAEGGGMLMPLLGVAAVVGVFYFYSRDKSRGRR